MLMNKIEMEVGRISDYSEFSKKACPEWSNVRIFTSNGDCFEKFIAYSRQDTALLAKLDNKLRFIELASELAHANTVLLPTTMGAVAVTEQAIINEAHKRGMAIPDRRRNRDDVVNVPAVGAYVAFPKKGLHSWIGSLDINSLYPSVLRSLNMGNETIVGQLRSDTTKNYIDNKINKEKKSAAKS